MTDQPRPDWFTKRVAGLFALYPQATMSSMAPEAWWAHLRELPDESIKAAFKKAPGASREFCPSAPMLLAWGKAHAKSNPKLVPTSRRIEEKPFSGTTSSFRDKLRETIDDIGK